MFKGFKLKSLNFDNDRNDYYKIGKRLYKNNKYQVNSSLESFFLNNKDLDGTKIINSWFPQINAHIFISHSHRDEDSVIKLAEWLNYHFNINSFIDSCIWGYGNDLSKILDDKFSWLDKENRIYEYEKVLNSTGHVHMMLSTALTTMMDKTECLIFYDSPNSIKPFKEIDKTESPWIYSEIAISQMLRQNIPARVRSKRLFEEKLNLYALERREIQKSLTIKYDLFNKHLINIDADTLNNWASYPTPETAEKALDLLYEISEPAKSFKLID